jgi:dolichol-phosphate mannosyltransferase
MSPVNTPIRLSIVAPCYREELGLAELHRRTTLAAHALVGDEFELILLNDGSPDGTWAGICGLSDSDARVVGVNLSRNHGHQLALTAGLSLARGERILIIDADLQDPPELLPQMMQALDQGADVAYGNRNRRADQFWNVT